MLSAYRFEKINGHCPVVVRDPATRLYAARCECNCDPNGRTVSVIGDWKATESHALEDLLARAFSVHGRIVMRRNQWACFRCGRVLPLSAHHKRHRSQGRNDRIENLEPNCVRCHEAQHRHKGE